MELLIINGNDYSRFVERKGYGWSRNDLDTENTTRLKNGTLRRQKLTTKRKLSYKMINMSREKLAQLDDDLSQATFEAQYLDLHGVMTGTFYCTSLSVTLSEISGSSEAWDGASFSMTEV